MNLDDTEVRFERALSAHRYRGKDHFEPASAAAVQQFEERFGHVMPEDFRYLQLTYGGVTFLERVSPFAGAPQLRATAMRYFGRSIELVHDQELERLYAQGDTADEWTAWLGMLVPFASDGDYNMVCLDFAFDPANPPVVVIDFESRGPNGYGNLAGYAADSVLQQAEFEVVGEDGTFATRPERVTQRIVDWYGHLDKILGNVDILQSRKFPKVKDINWPPE